MPQFFKCTAAVTALIAATTPAASPAAAEPVLPAIPAPEDAPIAFLVDAASGQVLFARQPDRRFMPASITKVMTTFLAFEWMEEAKILPEQVLLERPETWTRWHNVGSSMYLPFGAQVTVDTLLHGITTVSANDGAVALAEGAAGSVPDWIAAMNAKAREIGLTNSHFNTPNGWMDDGKTFVTARDLAVLGREMILRHPLKYRHYVGQKRFTFNGITQVNHDPITGVVPGADGIKTGFTNQAGYGFLGSAERGGQRLIMVVAGSPSGRARNAAARSLIEWGFTAFSSRLLAPAGAVVAKAEVQDGSVGMLDLQTVQPLSVAAPAGTRPDVTMSLRYEGPIRAPIAKGEKLAELIVKPQGLPEYRVPLVAANDVYKATFLQRIFNGIAGWLPG